MYSLLTWFAKRVKGNSFSIDRNVPVSYMLYYGLRRVLMVVRGFLSFPFRSVIFVDRHVIVRAKSKIKYGKHFTIYNNCFIDAMSNDGIIVGNNCSIGKFTTIECTGSLRSLGQGLRLGNNVAVGTHSYLGCAGSVEIGDDTIMGNFVSLHSENHIFSNPKVPIRDQGVTREGIKIGKNCWIGAKVTILDGVEIGDNTIIAAGALLPKGTYKGSSIYAGVPAKFLRGIYRNENQL